MNSTVPIRDPYLVKSVVHSSQLLAAFHTSGEALPLREISVRSGLPKTMVFRLLYTLIKCGMVEKVGEESLPILPATLQTEAIPDRLCCAGNNRLPVFERCIREPGEGCPSRRHRINFG